MSITQIVDIPELPVEPQSGAGSTPAKRRLLIDIPREVPAGRTVLTFTPAAAEPIKEREFGCLKGQIWMAEDFDAPLEDFKDYM